MRPIPVKIAKYLTPTLGDKKAFLTFTSFSKKLFNLF
jgi:hypothetical protein